MSVVTDRGRREPGVGSPSRARLTKRIAAWRRSRSLRGGAAAKWRAQPTRRYATRPSEPRRENGRRPCADSERCPGGSSQPPARTRSVERGSGTVRWTGPSGTVRWTGPSGTVRWTGPSGTVRWTGAQALSDGRGLRPVRWTGGSGTVRGTGASGLVRRTGAQAPSDGPARSLSRNSLRIGLLGRFWANFSTVNEVLTSQIVIVFGCGYVVE